MPDDSKLFAGFESGGSATALQRLLRFQGLFEELFQLLKLAAHHDLAIAIVGIAGVVVLVVAFCWPELFGRLNEGNDRPVKYLVRIELFLYFLSLLGLLGIVSENNTAVLLADIVALSIQ